MPEDLGPLQARWGGATAVPSRVRWPPPQSVETIGGAIGGVPLASSYAKTVETQIASLDAEDYAGKKQAAGAVACDVIVIVIVIVKQFYAAEPAGRLVSRRLRHDSRRHIWKIRFA